MNDEDLNLDQLPTTTLIAFAQPQNAPEWAKTLRDIRTRPQLSHVANYQRERAQDWSGFDA